MLYMFFRYSWEPVLFQRIIMIGFENTKYLPIPSIRNRKLSIILYFWNKSRNYMNHIFRDLGMGKWYLDNSISLCFLLIIISKKSQNLKKKIRRLEFIVLFSISNSIGKRKSENSKDFSLYILIINKQNVFLSVCRCVCMFVPKDLAKRSTDQVLLYRVASHRSWEGL